MRSTSRFFYLPIVKEFPLEIESELVSIVVPVHVGLDVLDCCCRLPAAAAVRKSTPALSLHPPGNVTKVHQHLMPVLHFLLQGVKYWFLWRPHSFRETVVGGGASGPPLLSYYAQ
jgi:hypothetical protein